MPTRIVKTGRRLKKFKLKGKPFTKKQVKAIKKIAEHTGELKVYDTSISSTSIVSGSLINLFSSSSHYGIVQGDGQNERIGDELTIKDYNFKINFTSGTTNGTVRLILFQNLGDLNMPALALLGSTPSVYSQYARPDDVET